MARALCLSPRCTLLLAGAKGPVSIDWIIDGVWVPIDWKPDVARCRPTSRASDPARASDLLVRALDEWQVRPYADLPHQEICQREITRLDELRLTALEERIEADLGVGRYSAVVGELEVLT